MRYEGLRIACIQTDCTVGDLEGNRKKAILALEGAGRSGADIAVFPELSLTGYPPEDLLLKPKFVDDNIRSLEYLAEFAGETAAVAGFIDRKGKYLYNSAAVMRNGKIISVYHKMCLPNYGVFDENRYFKPGDGPLVFSLGGYLLGVAICEDLWHESGPVAKEAGFGAQVILSLNASPYHIGKSAAREKVVMALARKHGVHIAYANAVGGQDELVFDGRSVVIDNKGKVTGRAAAFKEQIFASDINIKPYGKISRKIVSAGPTAGAGKPALVKREQPSLEASEEVYQALMLGLRDYVNKNGFRKVVIGLSGGIDSSLVAAIAADALGKDNVTGIFMPSRHSSQESEADAQTLALNLGIEFKNISIEHVYKMYLLVFEPHFLGMAKDAAEENLQARIRGNVLMAFANKFGWLVLTTGNKSEMSTGYATLYGDMAGGFAAIKDVPKTLVYDLAKYRNSLKEVIPERVFTKAPTAELRPNQKDTDSLPPYDILDPIIKAYVEDDRNCKEIVSMGFDELTVKKVLGLVDKSEYKRRQAPPGIKITPRALGKDRRMPITNRYSEFDY